jgi:membrane protease YdiL (CAAX protease family)
VVGVTPLGALLSTAACHGLFQLVAHGLSLARGALDIVTLGAAQALVYVLGIFVLLRRSEPGLELRQSLALRPTDGRFALIGVGLGVCLKLPAESLSAIVDRFFPGGDGQLLARAALYRTETIGQVLALVAVLCVSAPLVEESFFRGAIHGRLLGQGPRTAALVSGGAFVLVHPDVRHWPALAIVAAALSYLRVASGSLLPCLALHVAFNATGVLALVTGAASATRPLDVGPITLSSSWIAAGLLIVWLMRISQNPGAFRARAEDRA